MPVETNTNTNPSANPSANAEPKIIKSEYTETAREARHLMTNASRLIGQLSMVHEGELRDELRSIEEALDKLRSRMFRIQ